MSVDLDDAETFLARLERKQRRARLTKPKPREATPERKERARKRRERAPRRATIPGNRGPGFKDADTQAKALATREANRLAREQQEGDEIAAALLGILQRLREHQKGA